MGVLARNLVKVALLAFLLTIASYIPTALSQLSETQAPSNKLGPLLRALAEGPVYEGDPILKWMGFDRAVEDSLDVTIRFAGELSSEEVAYWESRGVKFWYIGGRLMHAGSIYPARVPLDLIPSLEAHGNVIRVEATKSLTIKPDLNVAVPDIRADRLWRTILIDRLVSMGITGKGVIVGIPDTGVDWDHPWLKFENGTSKVLKILTNKGVYIRGINLTLAPRDGERDNWSHGTAVSSIVAAGKPGDRFVGVAPDVGLLVASIFSPNDVPVEVAIIWLAENGANVISMSWSITLFEPRDGSSNLDMIIDELASKKGVVFVKSAGNDAGEATHSRFIVRAGTKISFPIQAQDSPAYAPAKLHLVLNTLLWRPGDVSLKFTIKLPGKRPVDLNEVAKLTKPLDEEDEEEELIGVVVEGLEYAAWRDLSPRNTGQLYFWVHGLDDVGLGDPLPKGRWVLTVENPSSRDVEVHAYLFDIAEEGFPGASFYEAFVEDRYTLTGPLADSIITVGAYGVRDMWGHVRDQVAFYSSQGPRIDGAKKPEIIGPTMVIAAKSQAWPGPKEPFSSPAIDELRRWFAGTSASAPFVAGVAALLLQLDPNLTPSEVLELIKKGARVDRAVTVYGIPWNPVAGWGKVDALGAFSQIYTAVEVTIEGIDLDLNVSVTVNGFKIGIPSKGVTTLAAQKGKLIEISVEPFLYISEESRFVSAGFELGGVPSEGTSLQVSKSTSVTFNWRKQWLMSFSYSLAPGSEPVRGSIELSYESTTPGSLSPSSFTVAISQEPTEVWVDEGGLWRLSSLSTGSTEEERWISVHMRDLEGVARAPEDIDVVYYHQRLTTFYYALSPGSLAPAGSVELRFFSFGKEIRVELRPEPESYWLDVGTEWSLEPLFSGSTDEERWILEGGVTLKGEPGSGAAPAVFYHQLRLKASSPFGDVNVRGISMGREVENAEWYDRGTVVSVSVDAVVQPSEGTRHVFMRWDGSVRSDRPSFSFEIRVPVTIQASWKTQYRLSLIFLDATGEREVTPDSIEILLEDQGITITLDEFLGVWLDEGVYRVVKVTWKGMELNPTETARINLVSPSSLSVRLPFYSLTVTVKDLLGNTIGGAKVVLEMVDGSKVEAETGGDGRATFGMIPLGPYKLAVSYFGQTVTKEGDASIEPASEVTVTFSPSLLAIATVSIAIVTVVAVILVRRVR